MAEDTESTPVEPTAREKFAALVADMAVEQADAMDALQSYIEGPEVAELRDRLTKAATLTVPNSMFESTINNTITVLDALKIVLPQARAQLIQHEEPVPTAAA